MSLNVPFIIERLGEMYLSRSADEEELASWKRFAENVVICIGEFYNKATLPILQYFAADSQSSAGMGELLSHMDTLHKVFIASQYTLLTHDDYEHALHSAYDINFGINLQEHLYDGSFMELWLQRNPTIAAQRKGEYLRYMLTYVRGEKQVHKTGFFFWEKLNLLISELHMTLRQQAGTPVAPPRKVITPRNCTKRYVRDVVHELGWKALWTRTTLCDRQFDSVIVVHKSTGLDGYLQAVEYSDVPASDVRAVFPGVGVDLPVSDTFVFLVDVITSLVVLHLSMGGLLNEGLSVSAMVLSVGLLTRMYRVIARYITQLQLYKDLLGDWVQRRRESRNGACIAKLQSVVIAQETSEVLLAYFFIWRFRRLSVDRLQTYMDHFIQDECHINGHVELDDSCRKLMLMKLAAKAGEDKWEVDTPPDEWVAAHPLEHLQAVNL